MDPKVYVEKLADLKKMYKATHEEEKQEDAAIKELLKDYTIPPDFIMAKDNYGISDGGLLCLVYPDLRWVKIQKISVKEKLQKLMKEDKEVEKKEAKEKKEDETLINITEFLKKKKDEEHLAAMKAKYNKVGTKVLQVKTMRTVYYRIPIGLDIKNHHYDIGDDEEGSLVVYMEGNVKMKIKKGLEYITANQEEFGEMADFNVDESDFEGDEEVKEEK